MNKLLRFLVRFFDGLGANRTSWKICGYLLKKEALDHIEGKAKC